MDLRKIRIKNIRSYEDEEIEFPEGSFLLSGDVGSGKTTILLAIEYALFGLQPGQRGLSLLRNGTSEGEVTLEFKIDGKSVIIERKLKRSGKSVSNNYSAITIDGEKEEISITELKTRILLLLNYPPEFLKKNNLLYLYTVYTPQENMKKVILEDPQVRLNIIRHIFGIEKYKRIRENLQILLNHLKGDTRFLQGEISFLEQDRTNLEEKRIYILEIEEKIREKEQELNQQIKRRMNTEKEAHQIEEKIKEKEKFENEVEKTHLMINTKRTESLSLVNEIKLTQNQISKTINFDDIRYGEITTALKDNSEKAENLQLKYFELETKKTSLEENQKGSLDKKKRIFRIDICPTCLQDVSENHKHNIINETEKELVEIKKTIEVLESESSDTKILLENEKNKKKNLEKEKSELDVIKSKSEHTTQLKVRLEEMEKQKISLDKDIIFLTKHLSFLKGTILEFMKYNNLYKLKSKELLSAKNEEKRSEIDVARFRTGLDLTMKEVNNIEDLINKKEESKRKLLEILEINDWLSGPFLNLINFTERNILMKLRREFSNLFNRWFNILAGSSFEAHLDENFTPVISQGEIEMEYSFLSGGERTAVALAYRLALNQTVNSILSKIKTRDIIILDEPTDGFSEVQLEKMRDVLAELNVKQLIIVSHERKIEDFVDNVIRLKKEDNVSTIGSANLEDPAQSTLTEYND